MAEPTRPYGGGTRVPAIPDIRTAKLDDVLRTIKEWIEVRQGARGDGLDKAVTFRDLLNARIAGPGDLNGAVGDIPPIPLLPGDNDPAIPPTPTNLSATGTLRHIFLSWEFTRGYSRLAHFEVWRSETDALGNAILLAQTFAPSYADPVEPETTYYYWVRAVSDAGKSPFNAVAGTQGETPFFLQGDETEVNGEPVVPRMYLKDGYIMNGVITNAKIGDLAVDDAKIANMNVSKLQAGQLSVGAYIESTNYLSGDTGFIIHGNGNAEFNNATVRGGVYATYGSIGGVIIDESSLQSTNYNGTTAGWRIFANGDVNFNQGTFRGALSAATGTFKGSLDAATGTFAGQVVAGEFMTGYFTGYSWPSGGRTGTYLGPNGLLMGNPNQSGGGYVEIKSNGDFFTKGFKVENGAMTISAINVIDTLQLRGNAVTIPASTSASNQFSFGLSWQTILTVTHVSQGSRVFVLANVNAGVTTSQSYEGEDWTITGSPSLRLTIDGSERAVSGTSTLTYTGVPGSGSHTYRLQICIGYYNPWGTIDAQGNSRNMLILEVQR